MKEIKGKKKHDDGVMKEKSAVTATGEAAKPKVRSQSQPQKVENHFYLT